MGNQVSAGHHGLPLRHRRDSDGPPVMPAHVPPGAVAVPTGRLRQPSGDPRLDTPGTFETPPCINIKPSLAASPSPSPSPETPPAPSYLSVSPSSSSCSSVSGPPPPLTPLSERWQEEGADSSEGPRLRPRARTTNNVMTSRARQVPTVFRYCKDPRADDVYLTGTMTGWRCVKMSKPEGETNWVHIHDTREGKHYYKFLVDGHWRVEDGQAKVEKADNVWNVMEVKKSDFEVFDALACDSFSLKTKSKTEKLFNSDSWCQVSPNFEKLDVKSRHPPTLPPHLLQVILNKDVSYQPDPILLEEPSHVMVNHLYAQAIRDDLLVLSSTQRFRKKYVTTLLYKPI